MAKQLKSNQVVAKTKDEIKHAANCALSSSVTASAVIADFSKSAFGELDLNALVENLSSKMDEVQAGDLSSCENMLLAQANALQSIFMNMARRAHSQEHMPNYEAFMRMALRAQNQSRATIETLAAIKNPPVIFAKQANISNGHQQINNGTMNNTRPHAQENINPHSELITEGASYEAMDTTGKSKAGRTNQTMAAMD
jgi:hypothetical protein